MDDNAHINWRPETVLYHVTIAGNDAFVGGVTDIEQWLVANGYEHVKTSFNVWEKTNGKQAN